MAFALVLTMLPARMAAAPVNGAITQAALPAVGSGLWELQIPARVDDAVIVAVIDTGVDYTNKDLADIMLTVGGTVKGYNAITKQESGFMDDSSDSHGTMTAGVIVTEVEKIRKEAGEDPGSGVKIMPVKALDANGTSLAAARVSGEEAAKLYTARTASGSGFTVAEAVYAPGEEGSGGDGSGQSGQRNQSSLGIQSSVSTVTWPVWPDGTLVGTQNLDITSLTMVWGPAQDDVAVDYYEIKVYREDEPEPILTVQTSETSYDFTGLTPGTRYIFYLQAFDEEGDCSSILPLLVTTIPAPGSAPPSWPVGSTLASVQTTPTTVTLNWTQAQDDLEVTGYRIYQDGELIQTVAGSVYETTVLGLIPSTDYHFQVQAGDADGRWTTGGPEVTVRTIQGTSMLMLNAPRRNINGSLYMGDTVKLELISTETGLHPEVTVSFKRWNDERSAIEDGSATVSLAEIQPGSRVYSADFTLTEGICKIISLEAQVSPGVSSTAQVDCNVAGRLKILFPQPSGLSEQEAARFGDIIEDSHVSLNGILVPSPSAPGIFLVEGLETGWKPASHINMKQISYPVVLRSR
ncbi:MAG TPA: fibronectin type III domain-containing protein [Clostridia bacterium]|nr:fibronectin type III domain-containing protein [Clostridia bacterium]